MPFTLAHPAAVLPLVRGPLDGLALVCGAMAPDIPYFIRATSLEVAAHSWYEPFTNATTTHALAGLVPTTLLLAMGLYLMLRATARPARWLAHGRWDAPTADDPTAADRAVSRRGVRWAWVPGSLLIGALTHLLWDSFTNSDGLLATRFDVLNEPAVAETTWNRLSQHASTAIGLAALAVILWRRRRSLVSDDAATRRRVARAVAGFTAVGLGAALASALAKFDPSASPSTGEQIENLVAVAVKGGGVAVGIAVLVATAWWWSSLLWTSRTDARPERLGAEEVPDVPAEPR